MIVFGLDIEEFEYAYRLDGPYDPPSGLVFDKTRILLDPTPKQSPDRAAGDVKTTRNTAIVPGS